MLNSSFPFPFEIEDPDVWIFWSNGSPCILSVNGESPRFTANPRVTFQVLCIKLVLHSAHPLDKETQNNKLSTSKTAQLPIFWSQIMPGEPKPWFHLLKALWVCPQVQFPVLRAAQLCMLQSLHSGSLLGAGASCGCSFILVPWERVWVFFHMCMKCGRRTGFPSLPCCVWVEGSISVWGKKDSSAEGFFGVTALKITHSISLLNLLLCVLYSTTVVF